MFLNSCFVYAQDKLTKKRFDTNNDAQHDVTITYDGEKRVQDAISNQHLPENNVNYYIWDKSGAIERDIVYYKSPDHRNDKSVTFYGEANMLDDGIIKQQISHVVFFKKDGTSQEHLPAGTITYYIKDYHIQRGELTVERDGKEIIESYSEYDKYNRINLNKTDSNLDGQWDSVREYENGYLTNFQEDVNLDGIWDYNGMKDHKRYQADLAKNNLQVK